MSFPLPLYRSSCTHSRMTTGSFASRRRRHSPSWPAGPSGHPRLVDCARRSLPLAKVEPFTRGYNSYSVRQSAAMALLAIGPAAEEALLHDGVPRLIEGLHRGDWSSRGHAAAALASLGPRAEQAAPVFAGRLTSPPSNMTDFLSWLEIDADVESLRSIGAGAVPTLTVLLRDRRDYVRARALFTLSAIGPAASIALPEIVQS